MIDIRYCRICWNTAGWKYPTGDAASLESAESYAATHGFGHEEWLFNFSWLIDGYRYGFLQPFRDTYASSPSSVSKEVILYTIGPLWRRLFVGRIKNCELITAAQSKAALDVYRKEGWLAEMASNLKHLHVSPKPMLTPNSAFAVSNIRFKPDDLDILDPMMPAPVDHKVWSTPRYQPLRADETNPWARISSAAKVKLPQPAVKLKSTDPRERAAQKGITFDPAHDRLQNTLFNYLVNQYGQTNVYYEKNGVDLAVKQGNKTTGVWQSKVNGDKLSG